MTIQIKSIYSTPDEADGIRVLMDRHWPRGMTRDRAALDEWHPQLAPSVGVAKHLKDDGDFELFAQAYEDELRASEAGRDLLDMLGDRDVTLLYAAKDPERNHAVVLRDHLMSLA